MAGGLITDYLSQGAAASRPISPSAATGTLSFYFATDTETLSYYDWNDGAWQDILTGAGFTAASTTEVLTGTDTTKGVTPDALAALWEQGANVASAATISLGEGGSFHITGTTTITDIDFATDKAGRTAILTFDGALTLTHNASTLILPGGANITTAAGDVAVFVSEGTDVVRCVSYSRATGASVYEAGRLIGIQVITATGAGTYTPTTGTNSIVINMVGAGGGGAGVAQPTGSNVNAGRGGGGGAYLMKRLTANFSGASYSVGAGGTKGAAGNNAGSNGGDTTFTDTAGSPTTYTAGGGVGGATTTAQAAPLVTSTSAGGTATNGSVNIPGSASSRASMFFTSVGFGSTGGSSVLSPAALTPPAIFAANSSSAGSTGVNYGGGGSGGVATGTGAAVAGGDGAPGILIIYEYS